MTDKPWDTKPRATRVDAYLDDGVNVISTLWVTSTGLKIVSGGHVCFLGKTMIYLPPEELLERLGFYLVHEGEG
jgi:hypothetical protein